MMHWIKFELVLLSLCLGLNAIAHLATSGYPERGEMVRQEPPPKGSVYLDTCEGRPTHRLGSAADAECMADYPGDFARGVFFGLSSLPEPPEPGQQTG